MKRIIFYILTILLLVIPADAREISGDEIRHGLGIETETATYLGLNPTATTAQIMTVNDNIRLIKYPPYTGVALSATAMNVSNVASYYFLSNPASDLLRPYSGFYATLNDGTKLKKVLLGAVGNETGETLGDNLITGGAFTTWAGADPNSLPDGWSAHGTRNATNMTKESTGKCELISDGTLLGIKQTIASVTGGLYKQSLSISSLTGSGIYVRLSSSLLPASTTTTVFTTTGAKLWYVTTDVASSNTVAIIRNSPTTDTIFDDYINQQVLTPSLTGIWFTPKSETSGWSPNAATQTITITKDYPYEAESEAYFLLNTGLSEAQKIAIDQNIMTIKYGTGVTLASLTLDMSTVAGTEFITNPKATGVDYDLRWITAGWKVSVYDGSKTAYATKLGNGLITGETYLDIVGGTDPSLLNGDFSAGDTVWTKGTGVTIGSGVCSVDGTGAAYGNILVRANTLPTPINKLYRHSITLARTAGNLYLNFGGYQTSVVSTASIVNGYVTVYNSSSNATLSVLNGSVAYNGTLDLITVQQVLTPSEKGITLNAWTIESGFNPNAAAKVITITRE
jgi:hypothetical protein